MKTPFFFFPLLCITAHADVMPAPLFSDHAVLQRGKPIPVWGSADASEAVSVSFLGETVSTKADAGGHWLVALKNREAVIEPSELIITGKNKITFTDIVVGDVWLCSGQSNMEMAVAGTLNAAQEIAAAELPLIRHIDIQNTTAESPATVVQGRWRNASPATVRSFTAVGFYFARDIHALLKVPVGLINSSWGGTPIEPWMSAGALAADSSYPAVKARWNDVLKKYPDAKAKFDADIAGWTARDVAAKTKGDKLTIAKPRPPQGPGHPNEPSALFNGMIHPLVPYAICGVLWYQGESNTGWADEYRTLFPSLITDWRKAFAQGDIPFYWVQLANFGPATSTDTRWAFLREAQDRALSLPATGQAVAVDIGEAADIHPKNKQEVGRRLALIAGARLYGQKAVFEGPRFTSARVENGSIRITLSSANGLHTNAEPVTAFELAGADKKFVPADARIDGETILVRSPQISSPEFVRYAWRNSPVATVYNAAGLPLGPFRSDR